MKNSLSIALALLLAVSLAQAETITFDLEGEALGDISGGLMLTGSVDGGVNNFMVNVSRPDGLEIVDLSGDFLPDPDPNSLASTYGTRTISPFSNFASETPIVIEITNLSGLWVTEFGFTAGDFGQDQDFFFYTLEDPSGVGATRASNLSEWGEPPVPPYSFREEPVPGFPGAVFTSWNLGIGMSAVDNIARIEIFGGSDPGQIQSLFWDNLSFKLVAAGTGGTDIPGSDFTDDPTWEAETDSEPPPGGEPIAQTIPEPSTLILVGGLAVLLVRRRRKN